MNRHFLATSAEISNDFPVARRVVLESTAAIDTRRVVAECLRSIDRRITERTRRSEQARSHRAAPLSLRWPSPLRRNLDIRSLRAARERRMQIVPVLLAGPDKGILLGPLLEPVAVLRVRASNNVQSCRTGRHGRRSCTDPESACVGGGEGSQDSQRLAP